MRSMILLDVPHETLSGIPHLWLCPCRASRTTPRDTLLHGLLVVGKGEQLQVVYRMIHPARQDQCHIVFLIVGIHAMFPCRSMPQRATYTKLVIVLFNVIISNKFNLESDVDDLIFFNVQLFNAESPTHGWEDVGSLNLYGAMAAAKEIATPYTQVAFFQ